MKPSDESELAAQLHSADVQAPAGMSDEALARRIIAAHHRRRIYRARTIRLSVVASIAAAAVILWSAYIPSTPPHPLPNTVAMNNSNVDSNSTQMTPSPETPAPVVTAAGDRAAIDLELAALDRTAMHHAKLAQQLIEIERHAVVMSALSRNPSPSLDLDAQSDAAAFALLRGAVLLEEQSSSSAAARSRYQEIIALFPQSHWARIAESRMTKNQNPTPGGTS